MKQYFPDRVDAWPLTMSVTDRNAYETTDEVTLVDVMYAIRELQKYVLQIAASVSPVSVEEISTATAVDVSALSTAISALQSQVAALETAALSTPTFSVVATLPATTTGYKNGDEIYVTGEQMFYKVVSSSWVQRAS